MLYGIRRLDFAFRVFNQAYRFCPCEEGATFAPDAAIFNDAICHSEQNSLLGAANLGLHSRSKCLHCGFSCIFFEVSDSLRGEAPSSAETTRLNDRPLLPHISDRGAQMAPWQQTSAQDPTRVLKDWALSFPAKSAYWFVFL